MLAAVLLLLAGPCAWAGDDGAPVAKPGEAGAAALKADDLEARLLAHDGARWALLLGRFVPIAVGILLLALWFVKQDKIKGGVLAPPPRAEPTLPLPLGQGVVLTAVAMLVAPALIVLVLAGGPPKPSDPTWYTIVAIGAPMGLLAALVLARRRRVQRTPADAIQAHGASQGSVPTTPPGLGRAIGLGLWGVCVAGVFVVPAALAWVFVLQAFGAQPLAQDPVRRVLDDASQSAPILMAVFGVVVAPLTEECVFRGMLYPGVRRVFGGGRRGAWIGAVIVSAVFAAVHTNLYAAVPLFVLAMVLTWVFETTNSLAASVVVHALHNGITMVPLLIVRYG